MGFCILPLSSFLSYLSLIFSKWILHVNTSCPFLPPWSQWTSSILPWLCLPPTYEVISSMSSSTTLSSRRIMWLILPFLSKALWYFQWVELFSHSFQILSHIIQHFPPRFKCNRLQFVNFLNFNVVRVCMVEGLDEGFESEIWLHSSGIHGIHEGFDLKIQYHGVIMCHL